MIDWFDQFPTIRLFADTIQSNGIQALKDITVFAMLWRAAMFFDKALDFLKPCDDALFAGRAALGFLLFNFDAKLGQQRVVVLGEFFNH